MSSDLNNLPSIWFCDLFKLIWPIKVFWWFIILQFKKRALDLYFSVNLFHFLYDLKKKQQEKKSQRNIQINFYLLHPGILPMTQTIPYLLSLVFSPFCLVIITQFHKDILNCLFFWVAILLSNVLFLWSLTTAWFILG